MATDIRAVLLRFNLSGVGCKTALKNNKVKFSIIKILKINKNKNKLSILSIFFSIL